MLISRSISRQCFRMRGGPSLPKVVATFATLVLGLLVGCDQQDATPKASHFEHDHDVAAHWPSDLADAARKIRERLVWIKTGEATEPHGHDEHDDDHDHKSEIFDLVSWIPEVAADTNLSEADWVPLYNASESLMANLHAVNEGLSSENRSQIESLCELIDDALPKIPDQFSSLKGASL